MHLQPRTNAVPSQGKVRVNDFIIILNSGRAVGEVKSASSEQLQPPEQHVASHAPTIGQQHGRARRRQIPVDCVERRSTQSAPLARYRLSVCDYATALASGYGYLSELANTSCATKHDQPPPPLRAPKPKHQATSAKHSSRPMPSNDPGSAPSFAKRLLAPCERLW